MRKILGRCASSIRNWRLLLRGEAEDLERWTEELADRSARPPQIAWEPRLEEVSSQGPDAVISSFEAAQVMSSL
jgi:hypothetical protein